MELSQTMVDDQTNVSHRHTNDVWISSAKCVNFRRLRRVEGTLEDRSNFGSSGRGSGGLSSAGGLSTTARQPCTGHREASPARSRMGGLYPDMRGLSPGQAPPAAAGAWPHCSRSGPRLAGVSPAGASPGGDDYYYAAELPRLA